MLLFLGVSLFIREKVGVRLTEAGEKVLEYSMQKEKLEQSLLETLFGEESDGISGELKIGSLSSLTRSMLYPCLDTLISKNANLHIEIYSRELSVLSFMAKRGEVDIVFSYEPVKRQGWSHDYLGDEINVLCKSAKHNSIPNRYFDHDIYDKTTHEFFDVNGGLPKGFRRDYLHDIYHIIDAVERGWGKAIIPRHMIKDNRKISTMKSYKALKYPIYISYPSLGYYPKALSEGIEAIKNGFKDSL